MRRWKKAAAILMAAAMMCATGCGANDALKREHEETASETVELESADAEKETRTDVPTEEDSKATEDKYSSNGEDRPAEETEGVSHEEVGATEHEKVIPESAQTNAEKTVWVGKTGTKYHKYDCRTLRGMKLEITLEEALRQGREACKVCGG